MPQFNTSDLFWLTLSVAMTGVLWLPYVLNRILAGGLWFALRNPDPDAQENANWAVRAKAAHANAVENLVIFAPLVLAVVLTGQSSAWTILACQVYFFARLAHYVVYVAGVPVARTLAFATGFGAQAFLAFQLLT